MSFIDSVVFGPDGLVPAIAQDEKTKEVLMVAYMNREALEKTISGKVACYYSRSRKKLWIKGETSGHVQNVKEIRFDCDRDAVLLIVEQKGAACHNGYFSCFYRRLAGALEETFGKKIFDPDDVYGKKT